jgi:3-oxoacyl-[acyl-carrier-protein] synthase II
MRPRIAITGIGVVCSVADGAASFTEALRTGRRGFVPLGDPRLSRLRATHAALIEGFTPSADDPACVQTLDRHVQLALEAMREAARSAGLTLPLGDPGGVVLGTCSGGMLAIERHYEALVRGEDPIDAELLFSKRYYTGAKVLAWAAGAGGPALTVVTACAAGAGAIAQGADLIRAGLADVVLAGGSDAFAPSTLVGFDALKATCEGFCAPFSMPVGLNLGEGAAFLVLEGLERARGRGAPVLAELLGSGLSNDAHHPTAPDPTARGQLAAMNAALGDAGIDAGRIDYVNAHGTGTRANDPAECRAVSRLLGDRLAQVPVSSTKSMIGHCLGGAGALEASATVLACRAGFLPPTAGFAGPREGCDLDCVPEPGRPFSGRIALSNSFGFAGNNACLVLDLAPDDPRPAAAPPEPGDDPVVITGFGAVTAAGLGAGALADSEPHLAPVGRVPVPVEPYPAGLVPAIDPRKVDRRLDLRGFDRCSVFAALAAREAIGAAGIDLRPANVNAIGLVLGLATGPGQGEDEHLRATFSGDFELPSLGAFPYVVPNEVAGNVARALMLRGHDTVLATGRGAGLAALASAALAVSQGHVDTVLAAGADELTERGLADGWRTGLFGPGTGVTPGEGAAVAVLERLGSARERGAPVLATVAGLGLASDPSDSRGFAGDVSLERALARALERAGISAAEVSLVAVGGGGEAETARRVIGDSIEIVDLEPGLGLAEAALPLLNLARALALAGQGSQVAALSRSREGLACAAILRT